MAPQQLRKPRVYWLTEEYFPPEMGGTGVVAAQLSQGIAARGVPMEVITRQTQPPSPREERIGDVRVRRIAPAGRLKGAGWRALPLMLLYLARLLVLLVAEARRYDIVVASGMKIIPLIAAPVCRLLGKKCIVRLESPFELVQPISAEALDAMAGRAGQLLPRILQPLQKAALQRAHCVVAISQEIANRLLAFGVSPVRMERIPNAIDLSKYRPVTAAERAALRSRLRIPAEQTIVLFVGRLSRAKGVIMLIEAWPAIAARHPQLCLLMVGSGEGSWDDCEAYVTEYVRAAGLHNQVIFAGRSERAQEYMQAADMFIFPSEYEGFGLSVGEALACALPSVLSSVGAAPELIQHGSNGFLFPPKDKLAMEEAFESCLAQRDRWPVIGARARAAMAPYDLARVVERYTNLCQRLARS